MRSLANRLKDIDLVDMARRAWKPMSLGELDRLMDWMIAGHPTWSGVLVDERSALNLATAWACTVAIASDVAALPLHVYRHTENGKELASSHPLYPMLHDQANPEMTAHEFRQMMTAWVLNWGNAYAFIEWDGSDRPRALWPLSPDRMHVKRESPNAPVAYAYRKNTGEKIPIAAEDVFHLRGLGCDGIVGYSVIQMARNSMGSALAAEQFAATLFRNGVKPSGVISVKENLGDEAYKRAVLAVNEAYAGVGNSHKAMILEGGATFTPISINPDDAQFLESRRWNLEEICRWYGVYPVRIGHSDKASTYASAEQFFLAHVKFTLKPWLSLWEQTINMKLLYRNRGFFAKHNIAEMIRGDYASMQQFYRSMVDGGIIMPNEVRDELDLNVYPAGDVFYRPLNTAFVAKDQKPGEMPVVAQKPNGVPPAPTDGRSYYAGTH